MFNERLKSLRLERSMSQRELAEKLSVSQQTVAKWELCATSPNPSMLIKIVEVFGVSADDLLGTNFTKKKEVSSDDIKHALFGNDFNASDVMLSDVMQFAKFIKQRAISDTQQSIKEI